jgi:transcriptional regulator with XRE-family HTH domain
MKRNEPHKKPTKHLPNRIREMRLARGLTCKQVAEILKTTPQAIARAETRDIMSRHKRYELANLFECTPQELEKNFAQV